MSRRAHELITLRAPPGPVGLLLRDVPADDAALSALARAGDGHQVYIHSIDPSSPLADLARLRDVIVRVTASVGDEPARAGGALVQLEAGANSLQSGSSLSRAWPRVSLSLSTRSWRPE